MAVIKGESIQTKRNIPLRRKSDEKAGRFASPGLRAT
jgi:hypothetical protein